MRVQQFNYIIPFGETLFYRFINEAIVGDKFALIDSGVKKVEYICASLISSGVHCDESEKGYFNVASS